MKLLNILEKLGDMKFDFSETKSASGKESVFSVGAKGNTIIKAAVPAGVIAAMPSSARAASGPAGTTATIVEVLNFALTLEFLESKFYNMGLGTSGLIPSADINIFNQIAKHEAAHVAFLSNTISSLGGTPVVSPTFDFTAGGLFQPFVVYAQFLALAQAFEDTGVRAYKGQAGDLMSNDAVLTAALQIHSVEARHASEVRRLRTKNGLDTTKAWITNNSRGTMPSQTQAVYNGEDNLTQGGVDASTTSPNIPKASITEAFDEPLTKDETLAIASLFIQP